MGWRFRKSFRLTKGLHLNVSRSGVGMSAGVPGSGLWWQSPRLRLRGRDAGPSTGGGCGCGCLIALAVFGTFVVLTVATQPERRPATAAKGFTAAPPSEGFGRERDPLPVTDAKKDEERPAMAPTRAARGPNARTLLNMAKGLEGRNGPAAVRYYGDVIDRFPGSPEADEAAARLATISPRVDGAGASGPVERPGRASPQPP
jgi:hypothetical protein